MKQEYQNCRLCPRLCGADRTAGFGRCGGGAVARVAAASLHQWEEPCLSGKNGAGAVFFSGCPLGCLFCQNREISLDRKGAELSEDRLAEVFRRLEDAGAETLDLVTPTHYAPSVFAALALAQPKIPVVWNTGGYELAEITVNGRPIDRTARSSVLILSDGDMFVPEILKDIGCTDFEVKRSVAAEYLRKRLVEKQGQLEEPCDYIDVE